MSHLLSEKGLDSLDYQRGHVFRITLWASALVFSIHFMSVLDIKAGVLAVCVPVMTAFHLYRGQPQFLQGMKAFLPLWVVWGVSGVIHLILFSVQVPVDAVISLAYAALVLLAGVSVFDLAIDEEWRKRFFNTIRDIGFIAAVLALMQMTGVLGFVFPDSPMFPYRNYSVFGNPDLLGGYMALTIPCFVSRIVTQRRLSMYPVLGLLITSAALILSGSRGAWLAAFAGICVAVPWRRLHGKHVYRLLLPTVAALIICVSIWPEYVRERFVGGITLSSDGIRARLWFWDGAWRMWRDHPVLGVGPGQYAYWSPEYQGEALASQEGYTHYHNAKHTLYAHCDPLQLLVETGVFGLICCIWILLRLMRCRGREWGALTALFVFSLSGFPYHSPPHALAAITLVACLFARSFAVYVPQAPSLRLMRFLPFVVSLAATGCILVLVVLPSVFLRSANTIHLQGGNAEYAFDRVFNLPYSPALGYVHYGGFLLEQGRYDEAERVFQKALKGLDTADIYLALGVLAQIRGEHEHAADMYKASIYRAPSLSIAWRQLALLLPDNEREEWMERARLWLPAEELSDFVREQSVSE